MSNAPLGRRLADHAVKACIAALPARVIVRRSTAAYLYRRSLRLFNQRPLKPNAEASRIAKGFTVKQFLQRVDRVAGDLNVLLVVVAIGLATLDLTFLVTQKVVDHLPPVTRVVADAEAPSSN